MNHRLLVCLLACVLAFPVFAGSRSLVRLEGWIVDSYCGAKNAHAEATEDTLACHKKGAKLRFVSKDGIIYDIADQERALEHVGRKVRLFGTVDDSRNLKVGNYIGADKKDGKKSPKQRNGLGLKTGGS